MSLPQQYATREFNTSPLLNTSPRHTPPHTYAAYNITRPAAGRHDITPSHTQHFSHVRQQCGVYHVIYRQWGKGQYLLRDYARHAPYVLRRYAIDEY